MTAPSGAGKSQATAATLETLMCGIANHPSQGFSTGRLPVAIVGALLLVVGVTADLIAQAAGTQAAPALKIVVLEGEAGVNIIDQKTAVAPVVEVRDRNDLPVVGAQVTFLIRSGAGRATLNNGLRQVTLTTNAAGRATVAVNPVARGAIQLQVNAAYQGQTAAATITQTNFATAAQAASASIAGSASAGGGGAGGGLSTAAITGIAGAAVGGAVAATQLAGGDDSSGGGGGTAACSFSLSPGSITAGAAGGATTVTVTASPSGCTNGGWTASSNAAFVTVSPASGNGSGNVTVTVAANPGGVSRTASVTIANQSVSVTQAVACSFAVSPTSVGPLANTGASASISVTASPSGCTPAAWTAASNAAFLTVSPASGSGSGSVTVTAAANTGSTSRSGTVTIAGIAVTVSQGSASPNLTGHWVVSGSNANPYTISHPAGSSNFTFSWSFSSTTSTALGTVTLNFRTNGTGTITGLAVRIPAQTTITSVGVDGVTRTCPASEEWNLSVNATGTSMSGNVQSTWQCPDFPPPTVPSQTVTLVKQ